MIEQLRQTCRQLLEEGKVNVIIGYGQNSPARPAFPIFITKPDEVDRLVWNDQCYANLAVYLTSKMVRSTWNHPAIIVKGCDARAVVVLEKESQIKRDEMVVIGMACEGVGNPPEAKCQVCDAHMPANTDIVIGEVDAGGAIPAEERYADLEAFLAKPIAERWAFWMQEFERCVKCYACRQVCPMCYCERCIADKNRPTCIDTSASARGNFAWHVTRAFHQAGRCVGCDECTRACPSGIDLRLLTMTLSRAAEENFNYRAGVDRAVEPAVGSYSLQDKENFIR